MKIRQKTFSKILFAVLVLIAGTANADRQVAKIVGYVPGAYNNRELLLLKVEGNVSGGCNSTGRCAIDSSSLLFKSTQASVVAAYFANTPVTVNFEQSCNIFPNAWDITYICVGSINC